MYHVPSKSCKTMNEAVKKVEESGGRLTNIYAHTLHDIHHTYTFIRVIHNTYTYYT
jgi:hypothetical protein